MIAVLIYGEFRTYNINLKENLTQLFGEISDPGLLHFYILTPDVHAEKEAVAKIITDFGSSIHYFETMDSCSQYNPEIEQKIVDDYTQIAYNRAKDLFTPRLYYRRCLIHDIMKTHKKVSYDRVMLVRPFDMVYQRCKSMSYVYDTPLLYYGVDSLFIGSPTDMDHLFTLRPISSILGVCGEPEFREFFYKNDRCLAEIMPLCLEIIYQALLYTYFRNNSKNLRYDYTRFNMAEMWNKSLEDPTCRDRIVEFILPFIETDTLFILHCPRRKHMDLQTQSNTWIKSICKQQSK